MSDQRGMRAVARLLALALVPVLAASTVVVATQRPRGSWSAMGAARVQQVASVDGADACDLLGDDEILRATGARSVISATPGPQMALPAGCLWQLGPMDEGSGLTWEVFLGVQANGGRAVFERELGGPDASRIGGLGDAAVNLFGADYVVKGDTLVALQFVGGGAKPRPSTLITRALTWLVLTRVSGEPGPQPSPGPTIAPVAMARQLVERLRAEPFGTPNVDAAIELLARSGIATYERPDDPAPMVPVEGVASPMELLLDQVRAMALEAWAGGGIAGGDLDPLVEAEPDLAAASYLLAGYVAVVETEGAQVARELMGEQDWALAPQLVFPQLVLTLFTSDIARERMADDGGIAPAARVPTRVAQVAVLAGVTTAQAGVCSQVSGFISSALARVFDALRVERPSSTVGGILASIWNFVVSILERVVTTIVREFGQRVLDLIGRVAATVGTVAVIVSAVRPWTVSILAIPTTTVKGVGGASGQSGQLLVRVDLGGFDRWPRHVEDCARVAGRPLPNLRPEGAPVTWRPLTQEPAGLVEEGARQGRLDASGEARLDYVTLVDDVPAPWERRTGTIRSAVVIERPQLEQLRAIAMDQLLGELPDLVQGAVGPFLRGTLDRVRAHLTSLISTQASGLATVIHHVPAPTRSPDGTPVPTAAPSAVWVTVDRAAAPPQLAGRVVELVSCDGPYGTWRGVVRLGGLDAGGGFTVPFVGLPVAFSFRGGQGVQVTSTSTFGRVPTAEPNLSFDVDLALEIVVDGRTMSITGEGRGMGPVVGAQGEFGLGPAAGSLSAMPIEPAPAGLCG